MSDVEVPSHLTGSAACVADPEDARAALLHIENRRHEYLISIDARDLGEERLWYSYEDGYLSIGCERPCRTESSAPSRLRYHTFLLLDEIEKEAIRAERCTHALLIHLPKAIAREAPGDASQRG